MGVLDRRSNDLTASRQLFERQEALKNCFDAQLWIPARQLARLRFVEG